MSRVSYLRAAADDPQQARSKRAFESAHPEIRIALVAPSRPWQAAQLVLHKAQIPNQQ